MSNLEDAIISYFERWREGGFTDSQIEDFHRNMDLEEVLDSAWAVKERRQDEMKRLGFTAPLPAESLVRDICLVLEDEDGISWYRDQEGRFYRMSEFLLSDEAWEDARLDR